MLELMDVKKNYDRFSLSCSMQVPRGHVTGLIGKNGAGKSTTFKLILGLISKDEGTIRLFDHEAAHVGKAEKANIGVVLADSGFCEYLTVADVTASMGGLYPQFDRAFFTQKCREFQLPMKKKIKEFSTGMKRKLHVLAAISHDADLLLLDEPTTGLDVVAREEILKLFWEYMAEKERSILISSHISSDLEGLCDDFYLIDNGQILMHEETHRLLDEYGVLKVSVEQYDKIDKKHIIRQRKADFGYSLLTDKKAFYMDNYPDIVIEKGSLDELIPMMTRGE